MTRAEDRTNKSKPMTGAGVEGAGIKPNTAEMVTSAYNAWLKRRGLQKKKFMS